MSLTGLSPVERYFSHEGPGNDSLLSGSLGLVYYYYNICKLTGSKAHSDKAFTQLKDIFDRINAGNSSLLNPRFSSGLAGLGFVCEFMRSNGLEEGTALSPWPKAFNEYLIKSALIYFEEENIDYLHGGGGILHYFSSLPVSEQNVGVIEQLVRKSLEKRIDTPDGIWWRNKSLAAETTDINFSLSHGQCGLLLIFLNVLEKYGNLWELEPAVASAVEFLLNSRKYHSGNPSSLYPSSVSSQTGIPYFGHRMAWCYGDLNIAWVLYRAGTWFKREDWITEADMVGLACVGRRSPEQTEVEDAHFCHGSAGIAQFFHTLYRFTQKEPYWNAYNHWMEQARMFSQLDAIEHLFADNRDSLLTGWPGIGLTLMSESSTHSTEQRPRWEKAFLL